MPSLPHKIITTAHVPAARSPGWILTLLLSGLPGNRRFTMTTCPLTRHHLSQAKDIYGSKTLSPLRNRTHTPCSKKRRICQSVCSTEQHALPTEFLNQGAKKGRKPKYQGEKRTNALMGPGSHAGHGASPGTWPPAAGQGDGAPRNRDVPPLSGQVKDARPLLHRQLPCSHPRQTPHSVLWEPGEPSSLSAWPGPSGNSGTRKSHPCL